MSDPEAPAELGRLAAQRAAAALSRAQAGSEGLPAPGDVFVLRETAEHAVQWLILARDPARPGQVLAVLVDTNQLIGSTDLEVGDDGIGPLVLRNPHGGWLDASQFDPEFRVGSLRVDRLSRARDHWFADAKSEAIAAREVDEDPEYQHWQKTVLQPAYRTLFQKVPRPERRWWAYAAAAAFVLAAGGAGTKIARDQEQMREIRQAKAAAEEKLQGEIQDLRTAQQQLAISHRGELDEQRKLIEEYEARIEEAVNDPKLKTTVSRLRKQLADALATAAIANPAVRVFPGGTTRGREKVEVPDDAGHVVMIFTVDDYTEEERYRFELRHPREDEVLWVLDGLVVRNFGEVSVGVPAAALERGYEYDIQLVRENGTGVVFEVNIRVE